MEGHCYVCYAGEDPEGLALHRGIETDTVFKKGFARAFWFFIVKLI